MNEEATDIPGDISGDMPGDPEPQFGLVDLVEAFTAMRHEFRTHNKSTRDVAERIEQAVRFLQSLENQQREPADTSSGRAEGTGDAAKMADLLADLEHQLDRATDAVARHLAAETDRRRERLETIRQRHREMNPLARFFARPLARQIEQLEAGSDDAAVEGLLLMQSRIRQALDQCQIERFDTLGEAFDPSRMRAIGNVQNSTQPDGHVAQQLTPGYRWRGRILRFADVRVAASANG